MKFRYAPLMVALAGFGLLTGATMSLKAGDSSKPAAVQSAPISISQEFEANTAYTGRSTFKQGNAGVGGFGGSYSDATYVMSPQVSSNVLLRLGAAVENDSFEVTRQAPFPNTLRSYNAIVGADLTLSDKVIMRIEAHPGLFGDDRLSSSDFMCPLQLGGTYLLNKNLQFIAGVEINLDSRTPVIGGPGIRWQFADHWVLMGIPPKPRIEYTVDRKLTLHAGAEISSGTYRLSKSFGDSHGRGMSQGQTFNSAILETTEIRGGLGAAYKPIPGFTIDVTGGIVPYRAMDLNRAHVSYHSWSSAPYAELGLSGSF